MSEWEPPPLPYVMGSRNLTTHIECTTHHHQQQQQQQRQVCHYHMYEEEE